MRYLIYIIVFLFASTSFAVIDLTNNNFGSSTSNSSLSTTQIIIWGGTAGDNNLEANVRNSCALNNNTFDDCNFRQVGPNVRISFTFSSDADFGGTAFLRTSDGEQVGQTETYNQGQTVTISVNWSDLCARMDNLNSDCTPQSPSTNLSGSETFVLGVENSADTNTTDTINVTAYLINTTVNSESDSSDPDKLNAGITDYSAFMGDEKVYFPSTAQIGVPAPIQLFPESRLVTGGDITALVAFFNQTSLASVNTASSFQILNLIGDYPQDSNDIAPDIDPGFIESFANETPVFTRLALQDEAGNVLGITPHPDGPGLPAACAGIDNSFTLEQVIACQYSTVPLEVAGLLADDVNCFIATATFGSSMHSTVQDFRAFRSNILLKSKLGKWVVKKYYKWGSYGSHFIVKSPLLQKIARIALQPAWLFAVVSLKIGLSLTVILTLLLGAGLFFMTRKLFKTQLGARS